jgi:hypothetical protein
MLTDVPVLCGLRYPLLYQAGDSSSVTSPLTSVQVGSLSWGGEHLLTVAYPLRRELIPTPAAVLGDDSLLLKYLNPHLAVVATMPAAADAAQGEPTVDDCL